MSDPNTINYQPLQAMKGAYSAVLNDSLKGGRPLWILIGFGVLEVLLLVTGLVVFCIYLFAGYMVYLGTRVKAYKNNVWDNFAAANGWTLDVNTSPLELVPLSMQFGHSPHYSPVIKAQLGSLTCDLLLYDCTTGSGKSSQTHYFTLARVPLPMSLPHILLLSKKSHTYIARDLADAQQLKLEGDFDDYFTLQIEKGQQIDALTVLTPDIMQLLVNYGTQEDIEILGMDMYFILGGDKRDPQDVKSLIGSAYELTSKITQNISAETAPDAQATSTPQQPPPQPMPPPMPTSSVAGSA